MSLSALSRASAAALVVLICAGAAPTNARAAEDTGALSGDWSGTSICLANHDTCRDEKALYHLTGPNDRNVVKVVGSKIVDGREIVMGPPLDFIYDPDKKTLVSDTPVGVFRFSVDGTKMEGTLTLASRVLYRRISLKKNPKPS
jgi:hypothetical protein